MSDILFSWNKNIVGYKELEEKAKLLKQAYDIGIDGLKKQVDMLEKEFKKKRELARSTAEFSYSVTSNEGPKGVYYTIKRCIINPLTGDDDFNKDIIYTKFRIINN